MTSTSWPAEPEPAVAAETHSAAVFFLGDRAYKVKKPVDLGFLDFRTVDARRAACHEEVRLNRRIAPDVYLGVADVVGEGGQPCDHLVVMRRMPSDRRLSTLVRAGADVTTPLHQVAHQVAALHARAPRSVAADEAAGADATRARWVTNSEAMFHDGIGDVFDDVTIGTVHGLAARYLDGRRALFTERVAAGRAVDGHGDLLADDIFCLPDGPRVLDCLDFDERLRLGDGLADAAFLAMDLERLGRRDLGTRFLQAYAEHADDAWPPSLAHHQVAYRAQVRAKVFAIRAAQGDPDAAAAARRLLGLARDHLEEGRVRLVVVGGLPGTGKSQLAAALGQRLDAVVIRSDEVRKELAGVPNTTRLPAGFGEGAYDEAATARTYEAMLERAGTALALGWSVVLDASWNTRRWTDQARALAKEHVTDLAELRCTLPAEVAAERIRARAAADDDPSDATPEIAAAMAAVWEPWPSATPIDTSGPPRHALAAALTALGGQPSGTRQRKSAPVG